jgi:CRISPR-associated exonuclease Cas4
VYAEEDLLPLSALQHLLFCERQAALIHVERIWKDNPLTVEGTHLHERADAGETESRGDVRIVRSLPLRNLRLGLSGKTDVVEFHRLPVPPPRTGLPGVALAAAPGLWQPFPVEYKRGKPKTHRADEVQLCAQALCLEEMLGTVVPAGALFYAQLRRRTEVDFDQDLRRLTEETAAALHRLFTSGKTPKAIREPKCDHCSLLDVCLPESSAHSAQLYLSRSLRSALTPSPDDSPKPRGPK